MSLRLVRLWRGTFALSLYLSLVFLISPPAGAQSLSVNREMGRSMLATIQNDIKKNYYDASFHGIDLAAHFKAADEKIKEAKDLNEVLGIIAATVMEFNDSHTFFLPPQRSARVEHGWQLLMIGDKAFIVAVKPGSDAEAKGLRPGDRVISVDGVVVTRNNLPSLEYIFYLLSPRTAMQLQIEKPDGKRLALNVAARVYEGKKYTSLAVGMASDLYDFIREDENRAQLRKHRYYEIGDDVLLWKMPEFDLEDSQVNDLIDKAKKRKALVLDLRGNGGGSESVLLNLIGNLFDHDVTVGELKRRSETKPMIAKSRGNGAFKGTVVVLIDSDSGSASEVFAQAMQKEKRAVVIGDRSAGLVMRSKSYEHQFGQSLIVYYGMSVTDADIINSEGKSLEHHGVTPDELMLPTADDLAAGRDPVLARAAKLAGLSMTPEKAGQLFPVEWRK
jgi:C-terminal processing protease CtpA/Prc